MAKTRYAVRPNLFIGFHGCDKSLVESLALGKDSLKPSRNGYDWLGDGIYFWENNVTRALEFAEEKQKREPETIKEPAVIGAIQPIGVDGLPRVLIPAEQVFEEGWDLLSELYGVDLRKL